MADANLKIPSEERIRFNASESIINAVSPRVDISTIPGGHRMVVTDIDGVETADIMDGVKGDTGDAAGFGTVSASVDANVGTPSVTVTSSGPNTAKNFDISFKNLKGNTGDAAGFGTVSASVDANVGTPSVTVTSSGPNTAKNFDISFKNLKGVKGDTGAAAGFDTPTASVDGYIGTPSVAVTATGPATAKKFDFAFHNLKGEKGDTGSIESLIVDGTEPEEGAGVSVDGPISELSAEGHVEQFSTSGKNLLEKSNRGIDGVSANTSTGGEYTVNSLNYDGSNGFRVICTTKASTWAYILIEIGNLRNILATDNVDYTLSFKAKASQTFQSYIEIVQGNSANLQLDFGSVDFNTSSSVIAKTATTRGAAAASQNLRIMITNMPAGSTLDIADLQLELGSTATEYEPYTGGAPSPSPDYPQEIEVVRGRNLCPYLEQGYWAYADGMPASSQTLVRTPKIKCKPNTVYIGTSLYRSSWCGFVWYDSDGEYISTTNSGYGQALNHYSAKSPSNTAYMIFNIQGTGASNVTPNDVLDFQLVEGFTPQPYVPYGYVGMEVRDANDQLLSTTPIPLPERGWVGSLPDGTADILHLDGAGKVEWELTDIVKVFDGTNPTPSQLPSQTSFRPVFRTADGIARYGHILSSHSTNAYYGGNNGPEFYFSYDEFPDLDSFKTWLASNPVTVLYPLAEPQTESLGYIDLPDIPEGSTVTIPELDALGISYYVDNGAVRKLVEQYKARLEATSFADIEDAVTELAAEVQKNTNRTQLYLGYDTVNGKQMISVFKRNV